MRMKLLTLFTMIILCGMCVTGCKTSEKVESTSHLTETVQMEVGTEMVETKEETIERTETVIGEVVETEVLETNPQETETTATEAVDLKTQETAPTADDVVGTKPDVEDETETQPPKIIITNETSERG